MEEANEATPLHTTTPVNAKGQHTRINTSCKYVNQMTQLKLINSEKHLYVYGNGK